MSGTFTLTGTLKHHDKVTPLVDAAINIAAGTWPDSGDKVVYSQGVDVITDASGHFSQPLLTETGLWYQVTSLSSPPLFDPVTFQAFANGVTKDLSEISSSSPGTVTPSLVSQVLAALAQIVKMPQAGAAGAVGPFSPAAQLNVNENLQAVGYDQVDNLLILATGTSLVTSADNGVTVTGNKNLPLSGQTNPGLTVGKILRVGSNWVCLLTDQATGCGAIYTSPAPGAGGTCTWTSRKNMTVGSVGVFSPDLATDGSVILAGEYGDPLVAAVPTPHVYRSTDNGVTWTTVFTLTGASVRHIHCVYPDSTVANQWWMTVGDGPSPCLYRSVDGGVTWAGVTALDSSRQSGQISDDGTNLYLAADSAQRPADLWVLDKATRSIVRSGSMGDHRRLAVPGQGDYTTGYTVITGNHLQDFQASNFGPHVLGARVVAAGVPAGATITTVNNTSDVTVSATITANAGPIKYQLMGVNEKWFTDPFFGVMDKVNGIYYFTTPGDSSGDTNVRRGLFCIPYLGGPVVLLDKINCAPRSIFLANGQVFCGNIRRPQLVPA